MFIVEFYHRYFGWLDYERDFSSRDEADKFAKSCGEAYPIRVRKIR